ncbi:Glutamyl-tRNA(Gln) amidotransferase subunit A, chloroplastic/mitochondrial [Methylobacterium crusticola]|uniref:Glutamyl-tRNA(Gln) amidotransferase subunit A, chloroplastic/mitochondrial n=2 Tax=Methylobacterium crusticola TaxID=1697972 RepID=A0ABQ4QUD3_9HYPH|nr:amidase [Methylobacterium crusticola]GJD48370.1 Glutamyl-tRNA(Gln) amidotransferase subunit A, chloroplastic/mitochondrial [Methylobacterium crusticola]
MSAPVSDADIARTILAGTVPAAGPAHDLPSAWEAAAPEPSWAERRLAAAAPARAAPAPALALPPLADAAPAMLGIGALQAAYAAGALDPAGLLAALRDRIARHPSGRDAVLAPIADADAAAAESARRLRAGTARPLEGVPFGIKDIIDCAGAPVTCGSRLTGARVAGRDATVVARLRAAGAIPLAMLATTEFACGSAHNPRYGAVGNPWNRERWTGGSSTGSGAALAARLMPLALGTDTGGSIRVPAAWCGITGLKPTRGLVPRTGVAPLSWTLDHVGPMARSAEDLARVMPWIAGPDGEDHLAGGHYDPARARPGLAGLRVGVPGGWFTQMQDEAVLAAWEAMLGVLERQGARLVPVDLGDVATAHADGYAIVMAELAALQEPDLDRAPDLDAGTRARLAQGRTLAATDYLRALRRRPVVQARVLAALEGVDVLVTPGLGGEAASLADLTVTVNGRPEPLQAVLPRNTMLFDYTGLPALMLPTGLGRTGLPVSAQIVAGPYDDALCLAVGAAFQRDTDHHLRAPPEPA